MMIEVAYDNGKTYVGTIEQQPKADRILLKLRDKLNGKDDYRTLMTAKIVSVTHLEVS